MSRQVLFTPLRFPVFQSQSIITTAAVIPSHAQGQDGLPQPRCLPQAPINTWKPVDSQGPAQKSQDPCQVRPPDLLPCPAGESEGASQARHPRGEKEWVHKKVTNHQVVHSS